MVREERRWPEQSGGGRSRAEVVGAEWMWSEQSRQMHLYAPESKVPAQYFRVNDNDSVSSIHLGLSAVQGPLFQVRTSIIADTVRGERECRNK